jgi:calreticulin
MIYKTLGLGLAAASTASAKVYFQEDFNSASWKSRWTVPTEWKPASELGEWSWTAGKWYADESDKGIQTSENSRFYGISAKLDEEFTNKDKELVVQFSVRNEQDLDCGGAYIKLLGDMDQSKFGGDTPYQVMFGPDKCGPSNKKTHVIFNYPPKNDNLLIKKEVTMEGDNLSHLYTLVVKPDNTFEVLIDMKSVREGTLADSWDFLAPKEIKDPSVSKPKDWVDAKKIPDPTDVKPEGYDDIPAEIPDPDATKPEDWDTEEDGEWEPPMVDNPAYKGPWTPRMIDNPEYKGEWKHPMIPNPDFKDDPELYVRCNKCTHIGFELWQVTAGTLFDNILVTDSLAEAKAHAEKTFLANKQKESDAHDAYVKASAPAPEETDAEGEDDHDHDEL